MRKNKQATKRPARYAIAEAIERRLLMSTYTVNTLSDAIAPVAGKLTLRQAVADANTHAGADTIAFDSTVFTPGSLHTVTLAQGQLSLTDSATIQGPGSAVLAIDGDKGGRVFQISSGVTVSMSGLTITNGLVTSAPGALAAGGGILSEGTLNLMNVTVSDNGAAGGNNTTDFNSSGGTAGGAGIYSTGTLFLLNSVVSGNGAVGGSDYYGMGGNSTGGGIYSGGALTITNSSITGNIAAGGSDKANNGGDSGEADGGGIYVAGMLLLTGATVSGNQALGGSGLQNSANGAGAKGGGVYSTQTSFLTSDAFSTNSATGGDSSTLQGSAGQASGGAIFTTGPIAVTSSTLNGNVAAGGIGPTDDSGPGGNAYGGAIMTQGPLTISSSNVSSNVATAGFGNAHLTNKASAYGGGIYSTESLTVIGSTISGNTAQADHTFGIYGASGGTAQGGGIFTGGTAVISSSTLAKNVAQGGVGDVPEFSGTGGAGGPAEGAGVYNGGILTITDSTLAGNAAEGGTGASGAFEGGNGGNGGDASGGAVFSNQAFSIYDTTVSGNTASGGEGGGRTEGSSYSNGVAGNANGAGVTITAGTALLDNTIISANTDSSGEADIFGSASSSSGYNLIGTGGGLTNGVNGNKVGVNNPDLAPLGNYGGPTQTEYPLSGSPVINAGNNSLVPPPPVVTTDQRGYNRIIGPSVDIGSVEYTGSVSGNVFGDSTGGGTFAASPIIGVTLYADLTNSGSFQFGDPTAMVDLSGHYVFNALPAGPVTIVQTLNSHMMGLRQTIPAQLAGIHVTVGATAVTGVNFADTSHPLVSGTVTLNGAGAGNLLVYADLNNDGKFESNENNKLTSSNGTFSFVSLSPEVTYTFRVALPAGDVQVSPAGNAGITLLLGGGATIANVNFALSSHAASPLTGTVIGTSGSYNNQGNTAAKAFDGNLSTFFDAPTASGSYTGLDLGSTKVITSISYAPRSGSAGRMVGGVFQASNSATFSSGVVTLYTVTAAPTDGVLTTVSISNASAYRYVRYLGPTGSFCNIAEAQFFGTAATAPTKLTGAVIGTPGSYNNLGNTITKVFDGNLTNYFDAPVPSGAWAGLDLGSAEVVTQVKYAPRAGFANRMVGGEIQASNTADFSSGVVTLYTITTAPASGVFTTQLLNNTSAYRYYRYIGPTNGSCNIAELEFDS